MRRRRCWTAAAAASDPDVPAPLADPDAGAAAAAPAPAAAVPAGPQAHDGAHAADAPAPASSDVADGGPLSEAQRIEFWEDPPLELAAAGAAADRGARQEVGGMVLWVDGALKGVLRHAATEAAPPRFAVARVPLSCALHPVIALLVTLLATGAALPVAAEHHHSPAHQSCRKVYAWPQTLRVYAYMSVVSDCCELAHNSATVQGWSRQAGEGRITC